MAATPLGDTTDVVPGRLEILIQEQGTKTTIALAGEWDLAERQVTRQAIHTVLQRSPESVVLDLSQLTFIDSSGVHIIQELQERSVQHDIRLVIVPGPRAVQRPFEILQLVSALPFLTAATRG